MSLTQSTKPKRKKWRVEYIMPKGCRWQEIIDVRVPEGRLVGLQVVYRSSRGS